ncbi:AKAP7 25 RNA ligase-like domain-containing protein [Gigaspora margarita]|uniref:AKAP7 25 RNA ligase-like domain-containing protein n=1 Tax=Gigaspora margarita TaxID=4874 RepID=A0A8H4ENR4_GIGMA|nr:AKAP7 25 RNA ligase-like domain-containing protein [Gigaspora margarita]
MEASGHSTTSTPRCMRGITLIHVGKRIYRVPTASIPNNTIKHTMLARQFSAIEDSEAKDETRGEAVDDKNKILSDTSPEITINLTYPQHLQKFIFGKNGYTLNQIQRDSKTTITIKRGDDNVVIKGTKENTEKAKKRIENVVKWGIDKLQPTHFISLPLTDLLLQQKVADFQSGIASLAIPNIDKTIFIRPNSLHLTMGVLNLHMKEDIEGAVQLLKSLSAEIYDLVGTRSVVAKLLGIAIMENNPEKANVLYAKVEESEERDVIIKIAEFLTTKFTEAGYMKKENRPFKLHATLINTSHRKFADKDKHKRNNRIPFSAIQILNKYADFEYGTSRIEKIHISKIGAYDESGMHRSEGHITLP